jgi:hypothetical protein
MKLLKIPCRVFCLLLALALVSALSNGTKIVPVQADVPDATSIAPWTSGDDTILNITIRHANPASVHYIDRVDIDVAGSVQSITLSSQSTVFFTIQHNLGAVTGTPNVRARAHCTTHGWGSYSSPIVVPEFSLVLLPVILVALTLVTVFARSKLQART